MQLNTTGNKKPRQAAKPKPGLTSKLEVIMPKITVNVHNRLLYCQASSGVWLGERALDGDFTEYEMKAAIERAKEVMMTRVLHDACCGATGPLHDAGLVTDETVLHLERLWVGSDAPGAPAAKRRKGVTASIQRSVLYRDGWQCIYCKSDLDSATVTFDHVMPVVKGGTDDPDNLVVCCKSCNSKKGTSTVIAQDSVKEADHV